MKVYRFQRHADGRLMILLKIRYTGLCNWMMNLRNAAQCLSQHQKQGKIP